MENRIEATTIIFKGRFKALSSSSYGVFIVFLDNNSKNVEKFDVVSSHFSTLYENNISMPWSEMEDVINKLKWKGEFATSLTHDIQASIEDLFQPGTGRTQDIWANIKKAQINKVASIFEEVLARPTGDKNIKCEVVVETAHKAEIEDIRQSKRSKDALREGVDNNSGSKTDAPASDKTEEGAVVLEVALVLSPLSGIAIYELKEGDKIMIKITEQSSRGQYFIDLLNASVENELVPIPASVVRVSKEGKIFTVLLNIGPSIYGKSIDEDTVKVKKYDLSQDKSKKQEKSSEGTSSMSVNMTAPDSRKEKAAFNIIFFAVVAAAIAMLGIMLYLFFP
jgi:hypothetical protein